MKSKYDSLSDTNSDIPRYAILKFIPHRRVISEHAPCKEIFDLYQIGLFDAPDSRFFGAGTQPVQENIELVELQPNAEYRPHYHKNSIAIIYITSGTGTFCLGNEIMAYEAGKRIVIPAEVMHGFSTRSRTLFLSIQTPPILNAETGEVDLHY